MLVLQSGLGEGETGGSHSPFTFLFLFFHSEYYHCFVVFLFHLFSVCFFSVRLWVCAVVIMGSQPQMSLALPCSALWEGHWCAEAATAQLAQQGAKGQAPQGEGTLQGVRLKVKITPKTVVWRKAKSLFYCQFTRKHHPTNKRFRHLNLNLSVRPNPGHSGLK